MSYIFQNPFLQFILLSKNGFKTTYCGNYLKQGQRFMIIAIIEIFKEMLFPLIF